MNQKISQLFVSARDSAIAIYRDKTKRFLVLGLVGVILCVLFGAGLFGATIPWRGRTIDSSQNLDYAWQLYHGEIPKFWDGPQIDLPYKMPSVQFVSQHPPLYYLLLSPIVGPLIDAGDWKLAILYSRFLTILLGVLLVLVLAWGGWVLGGKKRVLMTVLVPAIGTSFVTVILVTGDIYNDLTTMIFSSLALIISALLIRDGIDKTKVVWLSVVCALGMSTRASFASALVLSLAALIIAAFLNDKGSLYQKMKPAFIAVAFVVAAVVLTIGWFYLNNYFYSGSFYRTASQSWVNEFTGRPKQTYLKVLMDTDYWLVIPRRFYGNSVISAPITAIGSYFIFFGSIAAAAFLAVKKSFFTKKNKVAVVIFGLLLAQFVLLMFQQLKHAVPYGAISPRYFLPAILPIALLLAYGATAIRKLGIWPALAIIMFGWFSVINTILWNVKTFGKYKSSNHWQNINTFVYEKLSLPDGTLLLLIVGLVAGLATLSYAIVNLNKSIE